ncbi:hypothetical protein SUGI_0990330 [Cryptomeria japonica]|nr:hypothetical protein SUGI_0990330 [Cryptomeria japonica]
MEEAQVTVLGISTVALAVPSCRQRMFLSNLDLFWLPASKPQRLLFYRLLPTNEFSSIVDSLKKSLSSVLVHFYPFAGQLVIGQESGRPEIDCNDGGVEFVEALMDMPFKDLEKEEFQRKPFFKTLVQIVHPYQQHEIYNTPLLSIQVTRFEGGGICIGTAFHHIVADGNSFWHFMKSWAECSRNLPVSKPPLHIRTMFRSTQETAVRISYEARQGIDGAQIYKFMRVNLEAEHTKGISASYTQKPENGEKIAALKERTGATTSFIAVASQFWRCVVKAREIAEEEPVYFAVLADCRGHVKPPLPLTYFGNCLSFCVAKTTAQKLLREDVRFAAGVIEELISVCTAGDEVNNMIEWVESGGRDVVDLLRGIGWKNGTSVSSSPRFPVYEIDYGWGTPLNVQAASLNVIGGMFVDGLKDGSILVSTRLPPRQMETLTEILFLPTYSIHITTNLIHIAGFISETSLFVIY